MAEDAPMGVVTQIAVADLTPHKRNYNSHPSAQVSRLAQSIQRYGFRGMVVVQAHTNTIIAGEGRWLAAKEAGLETIPCDVWDCTDAEARAFLVDDNELQRLADPDAEALAALLQELDAEGTPAVSYDEAELALLLAGLEEVTEADLDWSLPEGAEQSTGFHFSLSGEEAALCEEAVDKAEDELGAAIDGFDPTDRRSKAFLLICEVYLHAGG